MLINTSPAMIHGAPRALRDGYIYSHMLILNKKTPRIDISWKCFSVFNRVKPDTLNGKSEEHTANLKTASGSYSGPIYTCQKDKLYLVS